MGGASRVARGPAPLRAPTGTGDAHIAALKNQLTQAARGGAVSVGSVRGAVLPVIPRTSHAANDQPTRAMPAACATAPRPGGTRSSVDASADGDWPPPRASAVSSAASSSVAMDGFSHPTAAASTAAISATAARATPSSSRSLSSRTSRRRTCSQHRRPHSYRPSRRERDPPTRRTRVISSATSALRRLRVLPLAASMAPDAPLLPPHEKSRSNKYKVRGMSRDEGQHGGRYPLTRRRCGEKKSRNCNGEEAFGGRPSVEALKERQPPSCRLPDIRPADFAEITAPKVASDTRLRTT
jgi:hypothetical protein